MKSIKYIYLLLAIGLIISSCKKDFLQQEPPTSIPIASAIKTSNDMADAVNGMYEAMVPPTLFGRDVPVLGDLMADNVYVSIYNSGRYLTENNFNFISTNSEAADIYSQGYYVILQANRILTANVKPSNDVNELRGEAYIVRALTYLQLVNFFAQPYTVAPDNPGVPIVLTVTNPNNPYTKPARAKVSEVYTQIIKDLDSAYAIMPEAGTKLHPINSEYLCKYAAKAIEARAYLYMGNYTNAITAGSLVIQYGGYTLVPASGLNAYWADPKPVSNKEETIFELSQTITNNNSFDALASEYSQSVDGYGDLLVTPPLYALYSKTDARKGLIIHGNRGGSVLVCNKYPNLESTDDKDDIKIIRYAEVILTVAEGYAREGDDQDALNLLNTFVGIRDPSFKGYSESDTVASVVVTERRKELAFEGLRYFDLTRLNLPIVRPQIQLSAPSIELVPVGDHRRLLPIPQAEIDADPNTVQNPGYRSN